MNLEQQKKEARFVTVLAWVIMGFFGYSTTVSFVLFGVFLFKPPVEILEMVNSYVDILMFIPPKVISLLKNHYIEFTLFSLVLSVTVLIVSFALLKRRNWARIFIIVFMILTIFISIGGLFFHDFFMLEIPANEYMQEVIETMNHMIDIFLIVLTIVIAAVHGWVAWKLLSKDVKDEFVSQNN